MKKYFEKYLLLILPLLAVISCTNYPIDEDGLLISDRKSCYVSNFDLLDVDERTVKSGNVVIDTVNCTILVNLFYGTRLENLWPKFSLAPDCKLSPKITSRVDFSDSQIIVNTPDTIKPENPKKYTVISGNRKVSKTYSIYVNVLPLE